MIGTARVVGLITARAGSQGLPGKNIRDLCGHPLIAWSINAALRSTVIDDLIVSTDSEDIAKVARRYGAEVPFLRPAELATETATSADVIVHAIEWLQSAGRSYDILVLIEPTSPLREPGDIDAAVQQMAAAGAEAVVSVCRAETEHPVFMYRKNSGGILHSYIGGPAQTPRRQDIEPVFFLEGSVYATMVPAFLKKRSFVHDRTVGYDVPKWKSPEIDDLTDFLLVETIMRHKGLDKWTPAPTA